MKNLKYFENFDENKDWKIGDILIALENRYLYHGNWQKKGVKYRIKNFENNRILVQECESTEQNQSAVLFHQPHESSFNHEDPDKCFIFPIEKKYFILLDDWELKNDTKNFNL